jgi:hypothetical protein
MYVLRCCVGTPAMNLDIKSEDYPSCHTMTITRKKVWILHTSPDIFLALQGDLSALQLDQLAGDPQAKPNTAEFTVV